MTPLEKFRQLVPTVAPKPPAPRLSDIIAPTGHAPRDWQIGSQAPVHEILGRSRPPVSNTPDLERILALPRRPPIDLDGEQGEALADLMTERLSKPNASCKCEKLGFPCITRLKPAQAWALYEAPLAGGLIANIGVGSGKTGLDILMAKVMPGCKSAVLFVPPSLIEQLRHHYLLWAEHWHVPSLVIGPNKAYIVPGAPVVHVVPYSKFSRAEATELLETLKPDLAIADEVHKFKHANTATTSRFLRYMGAHPSTRFCGWGGTITDKSILDYTHLSAFALKGGSPVPLDPEAAKEWAMAIDPSEWPAPMGSLARLCRPGEHVHAGYSRRLLETRGVVTTTSSAIGAAIYLHERKPLKMPHELEDMITTLRASQVRPDGEELIDAISVASCARQLACGFYYRWRFPHMEPEALILEWFEKRKAWHKELREKLKAREPHLDSPLLCAKAAIRANQEPPYDGDLPVWGSETWAAWRDIRGKVYHETETVWVDEYLARDTADWAGKHKGIVWYEFAAFGAKVAELSGLPLFTAGKEAKEALRNVDGKSSIIASIAAHGTGHDGLQYHFANNFVANPPGSGLLWEQLLGRTHRVGQKADEVHAWTYRHTAEMRETLDQARSRAAYTKGTLGSAQKILAATTTF